ncbi:MAG: RING finger protein [Candidatus Promineifilaceae bacterium]|nr:RING finger protein [Candidatus Promineifilaceae bacterium]
MALSPVPIDKSSPFLGEDCALCKEAFALGERVIVCPEDATRHHTDCWQANGNRCTAYGCHGSGEVGRPSSARLRRVVTADGAEAKVETLPARGFHCAQSCLLLAIAIAIVLFAIGCFGLWAIADYVATEYLGWDYRPAISGTITLTMLAPTLLAGLVAPD